MYHFPPALTGYTVLSLVGGPYILGVLGITERIYESVTGIIYQYIS